MSRELTLKQEKYCQEYMSNGGNSTEAYRSAYDIGTMSSVVITTKATELKATPPIKARLKELGEASNKKYEVTRDQLNEKLQKIMTMIEAKILDGDLKPTVAEVLRKTTMDMAKLNGLIIDKAEVEHSGKVTVMPTIKQNGQALEFNVGRNTD